ncbi:MAG: hypothetical protein KIT89_04715 [Microcella sp.]|uniref:hypothetical protein n=1 Tax=Microcella sp. TaxID=1913979 RepID=UPI0024C745C5|nr:hypothetical protein [Microcella sp.]UYN84496.1 MAG: hypothetical protein KIT89_04715 [Microcella sp.]
MSDDLSTVDAAQLERWAYGRPTTGEEQGRVEHARAVAALAELRRRAAAEHERAQRELVERAAAEAHASERGATEAAGAPGVEALTDSERRHRRRMLTTGIAGLTAAALSLGAGVYVLNQPDPDPLAIFEREETQLDRDWALRLDAGGFGPITTGPRAIELDDDRVIVVARVSTVTDGRSTEWDAYCLFMSSLPESDGSWGLSGACTYPERFERDGLILPDRPSLPGDGFDTAIWGPEGEPRIARNQPLYGEVGLISSVLDWLAAPANRDPQITADDLIDHSERLLMGPVVIPLSAEGADLAALRDSGIQAIAMLIAGERPSGSPRLCVYVDLGDGTSRLPCAALGTVRREGIEVPVTANGRNWLVTIGADGRERSNTVRLLD